jgi:predicted RNA-binding protein YlxR (DUF448 family)
LEIDLKGKRSGRGAYVCPDRTCWDAAMEQSKLGRILKCQVSAEDVACLSDAWSTVAASLLDEQTVAASE